MLIQGELTPLVLVSMDPRQLASDEQKERINSAANDAFKLLNVYACPEEL